MISKLCNTTCVYDHCARKIWNRNREQSKEGSYDNYIYGVYNNPWTTTSPSPTHSHSGDVIIKLESVLLLHQPRHNILPLSRPSQNTHYLVFNVAVLAPLLQTTPAQPYQRFWDKLHIRLWWYQISASSGLDVIVLS